MISSNASSQKRSGEVLFVNHTGLESGAEHSLLTLIDGMPPGVGRDLAGGRGWGGEPRLAGLSGDSKIDEREPSRAADSLANHAALETVGGEAPGLVRPADRRYH